MMHERQLQLLEALKTVIRETNRCIVVNDGYTFKRGFNTKCLFKTWMCKEVRGKHLLDYCQTQKLTGVYLHIQLNGPKGQISGFEYKTPRWEKDSTLLDAVDILCNTINCEELLYSPLLINEYDPTVYSKQKSLIETLQEMSFSDIGNIKFQ